MNGIPISIFGNGSQTRDFIHVNDVSNSIIESLDSSLPPFSVFNLGTGKGISIIQLLSFLEQIFIEKGFKKGEVEFHPPREGEIIHSIAEIGGLDAIIDSSTFLPLEDGLISLVEQAIFESRES